METDPNPTEDFIKRLSGVQNALRGFVYAHLHDASQADDVIQEITIILWKRHGQYRPESPYLAWALGIARNKILHARRQSARSRLVFNDELATRLAECYDDMAPELEEQTALLAHCMKRLPPSARQLVRMRYSDGLSFRDIARRLAKQVNAVTKAVSRIRAALIACVDSAAPEALDPRGDLA